MRFMRSPRRAGALTRAALLAATLLLVGRVRAADEVNLLSFGDWGCGSSNQMRTAKAMATYVGTTGKRFDAALLLGDNFYTVVPDASSPIWENWFEKMYDPTALNMPFYALLGNHDCEHSNISARAELDYSVQHPESRWKMPSRYYRVDFPAAKPLVSVLMIDGNLQGSEWDKEAKWLKTEMERSDRPRWMIFACHFPIYSNNEHGDNKTATTRLGPLMERSKVDFYLAGHDHNLQHIQTATNFVSHIVSGAGGKTLYPMFRDDRGPFTASTNGFVHLNFTAERATVRFVSESGRTMHLFERMPDGKVEVRETTGIQKAVPRPEKKTEKKE